MQAKKFFFGGLGLFLLGMFVAGLSSLGDWFINYTVINNADQPLLTWHKDGACSRPIGHRYDYSDAQIVPAGQQLDYHYTAGPGEDGCIQVTTVDRRLVMSVPYKDNAIVVVPSPVPAPGQTIPAPGDLPKEPWSSRLSLKNVNLGQIAGLSMIAGGVLGVLGVLGVITVRTARRMRDRMSRSASNGSG